MTTIWFSASAILSGSSVRGSEAISCRNEPAMTAWKSSTTESGRSASVMASRYESVATILSKVPSKVMSTPVRMARLSSFDTTRATRLTMEANWENGMDTSCCTSTCGNPGKSSASSALMENEDVSHVMTAESPSEATCTAASGRFFTISENSLPGNTPRPSSSTSAGTSY